MRACACVCLSVSIGRGAWLVNIELWGDAGSGKPATSKGFRVYGLGFRVWSQPIARGVQKKRLRLRVRVRVAWFSAYGEQGVSKGFMV